MTLSGEKCEQLQKALLDAFPHKTPLEEMLKNKLNKNLDEIAEGKNLGDTVFYLIDKADAEGWVQDLISAAHESNPGNFFLNSFVKKIIGLSLDNALSNDFRKEKYKITEADHLATGIYTEVYQTTNDLGKQVVLKKLQKINIKKQFKSAITKAFDIATLPNFITIYDFDTSTEEPYYVMQYIKGNSLRKYFEQNRELDFQQKIKIILNIGRAMITAMENPDKPAYLNIKPSNIMIDSNNEPFISAFNLFVELNSDDIREELQQLFNKNEKRLKEELAYLLPDRFSSAGVNQQANQYMLGLLAYELITKKIPPSIKGINMNSLDESKLSKLLDNIFKGKAFKKLSFHDNDINSKYPDEIKNIILRMTDLDPDNRFKDLQEALDVIDIYSRFNDEIKIIRLVKESFSKCIKNQNPPSFFEKFYEKFKSKDGVAKFFKDKDKTSWERHHKIVEKAILLLIWYYEEKNIFKTINIGGYEKFNFLDNIITPHIGLGISEDLFESFKMTLIDSIIEYDINCNNGEEYKNIIKSAWETVLEPGFKYIRESVISNPVASE